MGNEWDEAKHPRVPKGSAGGGEFAAGRSASAAAISGGKKIDNLHDAEHSGGPNATGEPAKEKLAYKPTYASEPRSGQSVEHTSKAEAFAHKRYVEQRGFSAQVFKREGFVGGTGVGGYARQISNPVRKVRTYLLKVK